MEISRATTLEASESLCRLYFQLYGQEMTPDVARINNLIARGDLAFYVVMDGDTLVGMASVAPCRTAIHNKLWIEDVCVLDGYRGQGLARSLVNFAMEDAATLFGEGTFWLTSRPSRVAARSLYKSLGFIERETGVFCK